MKERSVFAKEALSVLDKIGKGTPGFNARAGQQDMVAIIADALSDVAEVPDEEDGKSQSDSQAGGQDNEEASATVIPHPVVVVEAGTGTGKSLAYLASVVMAARRVGAKVLLSTGTVALQEQLITKDIPLFAEKSGLNVSAAMAKGRGRYACPVKMEKNSGLGPQSSLDLEDDGVLGAFSSPTETVGHMQQAFTKGIWDGDLDNWSEALESRTRADVTMKNTSCLKRKCPKYNCCPFYTARKKLEDAEIVVSNHHLTLADLRIKGGGIITGCPPEKTIFVIDEGHHLVQTAKAFLERNLSTRDGIRHLIGLPKKLRDLTGYLQPVTVDQFDHRDAEKGAEDALARIRTLRETLRSESASESDNGGIRRFSKGTLPPEIYIQVDELHKVINTLAKSIKKLGKVIDEREKTLGEYEVAAIREVYGEISGSIEEIEDCLYIMKWQDERGVVPFARWIEKDVYSDVEDFKLHVAPTRVGHSLKKMLWERAAGAVLTSATLSSLGTFDKIARETGLSKHKESQFSRVDSPFDYAHHGAVYVPRMKNEPKGAEDHKFYAEIAEMLPTLLKQESGGSLVLFTARRWMKFVRDELPPYLQKQTLMQGDMSKSQMLKEHGRRIDAGGSSTLFGLASLAEGLDLPGDLCRHVVITRLAFQPPNDPVNQTIEEHLKSKGGSAFNEIMLPEASTRLVQAAGRLLRKETDEGRISILDRRIVTKRYGAQMLKDLPPFRVVIEGAHQAPAPDRREEYQDQPMPVGSKFFF